MKGGSEVVKNVITLKLFRTCNVIEQKEGHAMMGQEGGP